MLHKKCRYHEDPEKKILLGHVKAKSRKISKTSKKIVLRKSNIVIRI